MNRVVTDDDDDIQVSMLGLGAGQRIKAEVVGHRISQGAQPHVQYLIDTESGTVLRRYGQFDRLHAELRKKFPRSRLPVLPPTKSWRSFKHEYMQQQQVSRPVLSSSVCYMYSCAFSRSSDHCALGFPMC